MQAPAGSSGVARRRGDFVQSLERGLSVIRAFDSDRRALTLSEVAVATGLTRAAARRFLLTLTELDYVRVDGKRFSLGPRILELGYSYLASIGLTEVAQSHVEDLVAATRETASVAVLDRDHVVYVMRVPTRRVVGAVPIAVGTRLPAYPTSMGRVLLAGLPPKELERYLARVSLEPLTRYTVVDRVRFAQVIERVRRNGYAVTDQELLEGLQSAAAPIRDPSGRVVAAVNAAVTASRTSMEILGTQIVPQVVATARRIEASLASREAASREAAVR
jgi:IclR family pca regulon transcriptional regulator